MIAEKKVATVGAEVERILGYGATQFRQIVLLPQGRFETFLTASTEERLKILRDLFDVTLYRRVTEELKDRGQKAARRLRPPAPYVIGASRTRTSRREKG